MPPLYFQGFLLTIREKKDKFENSVFVLLVERVTMGPSLCTAVPIYACCPNIISNTVLFVFQKGPDCPLEGG